MMRRLILAIGFIGILSIMPASAEAQVCRKCGACEPYVTSCAQESKKQSDETIKHITAEWLVHREWVIKEFWEARLLPALMLMTEQLTVAAMQQVQIVGTFFDAKHQLESQRLLQELAAQAHKDYQPSEGMCTFGTGMRSLAASDRNTEFTAEILSTRALARQTLQGDNVSGSAEDRRSRFAQFTETYCEPKDNANGLSLLCGGGGPVERRNRDIDFTATLDAPATLTMDMTEGAKDAADGSNHAEDIFALAANLYGHKVPEIIKRPYLSVDKDDQPSAGAKLLQNMRAVIAKRSVAQNSYAAIAAQKAQGEKEVQPYLVALLKEMGVPDDDITAMLGERPSYYAQMEVLTKKIYQSPNFYTDLYDKPANVKRKEVAMQAIDLMQKRDMFRSLLRSEANLSVMLETQIAAEQRILENEITPGGQ